MIQESNANYQLAYKTGTGTLENGRTLCPDSWLGGRKTATLIFLS
jgi:hypothetical protein